jgi:predicted RNA binding protein YcfA (HicA-like mRNA interferase family)
MSKDMNVLIKAAESQGWTVTYRGSGHYRFKSPSGAVVFTSSTPGGGRALANTKALLKRNGLTDI